jgi:hypothetical protein
MIKSKSLVLTASIGVFRRSSGPSDPIRFISKSVVFAANWTVVSYEWRRVPDETLLLISEFCGPT